MCIYEYYDACFGNEQIKICLVNKNGGIERV